MPCKMPYPCPYLLLLVFNGLIFAGTSSIPSECNVRPLKLRQLASYLTRLRPIDDSPASIRNNSVRGNLLIGDNIHRIHVDASSRDKQRNRDQNGDEMVFPFICICDHSDMLDVRRYSVVDIRYKFE